MSQNKMRKEIKLPFRIDFGRVEGLAISRKRCKIGRKLVLISNRKSYMSFRLVPKSVTLNDLERRNGPYIALFHQIFMYDVVVKQLLGLSRHQIKIYF